MNRWIWFLILHIWTLIDLLGSIDHQFYVYDTEETFIDDRQYYDCLHYYVVAYFEEFDIARYIHRRETIAYCMRLSNISNNELSSTKPPLLMDGIEVIKFGELFRRGVSSQQLLTWSTSINLVEDYQIYLTNPFNVSLSQQTFYNCSTPWFGKQCQYRFLNMKHYDFDEVVQLTFLSLEESSTYQDIIGQTCYIHLECHRGPHPLCLDWREICDAKVDCLDGGQDEENCFDLELNECDENEYRCHNGMQCIPLEFVNDNKFNSDCIDQTDEPYDEHDFDIDEKDCFEDPSSRCEERSCRPILSRNFACGDGECTHENGDCSNGRGNMITMAMILPHLQDDDTYCRLATMCVTWRNCPNICSSVNECTKIIKTYCKQSLFVFPDYPILFGHVRFIFSNNRSLKIVFQPVSDDDILLLPSYLCYDKQLCGNIFPVRTILFENFTCLDFDSEFNLPAKYRWIELISSVKEFFSRCSTIHDIKNKTHCRHSSMYQCVNSTKCISKYRLNDGLQDCYQNDDESLKKDQNKSNSLTDPDKMIDPFLFPLLCDGYVDMKIDGIENETDETNCNWWPCSNIYTRCNHIWNCHNGIDEINCPYLPFCPQSFHPCISPDTFNLTCLSIDQAGNGVIDCVGATDEAHMCRKDDFLYQGGMFRCWNESLCLQVDMFKLCDGKNHCPFHDDELICDKTYNLFCIPSENTRDNDIINFLCQPPSVKPEQIFLSLRNLIEFPEQNAIQHHSNTLLPILSNLNKRNHKILIAKSPTLKQNDMTWECNRGIHVVHRKNVSKYVNRCLCPPAYYGDTCQYQNQRVSVILQLSAEADWRTTFALVITLVDEENNIESYKQIQYLSIRDCDTKFNFNLLYSTQPKNISKNYSVRIDAYNKHTLIYHASWIFHIIFPFLPVYGISTRITIPINTLAGCTLVCHHGHCIRFLNKNEYACQCDPGWIGSQCSILHDCHCSSDSRCVVSGWPPICICPLNKFGLRCYLTRRTCQPNTCNYHGECIPTDERIAINNFTCICHEGFSGQTCQHIDTKITINFHEISVPSNILGHFVTADNHTPHIRTTLFKKISPDEDSTVLYTSNKFHLLFTQFFNNYYLAIAQETSIQLAVITTTIVPRQRCPHIREFFNSTVLKFNQLRRIKIYHLLCEQRSELICFHDEIFMCLCDTNRFANCFGFNHTMTYNCQGNSFCKHGAQCFQDKPKCPTASMCVCAECFYGTYCQFSTASFALSLDVLLGYKIRPHIIFTQQPLSIKISATIVIVMFVLSIISNICSILTFQTEISRKVGCGLYLLSASIISVLTMIIFLLKFFSLIYTQININIGRSFLLLNCKSMDFLLRVLLSTCDWLNACVAAERAFTVLKSTSFDKRKSKYIAKRIIIVVIVLTTLSAIHDPLNRNLIDDIEEQRIWCITSYSSAIKIYDSFSLFFHFLGPFSINGISAFITIITLARQRAVLRTKQTYEQHLREQLYQNRYLLTSPCILVLLAVPRLILSFLSNCMQSPRDPWRFLIGYFVSFFPSVLIFVVFVLPSNVYRKEFIDSIKRLRLIITQVRVR